MTRSNPLGDLFAGAVLAFLLFGPAQIADADTVRNGFEYRPGNRAPLARLGVSTDQDFGFVPMPSDPSVIFPMTDLPRPGYLAPQVDPVYGTTVTRITNDHGLPLPFGPGTTWGDDARHHYSKDQPWNSDGTLIAIQNSTEPDVVFLDGETYELKFGECSNYDRDDDRWHPSPQYPHIRINANDYELSWFDVVTCTKVRSWTLPFKVKHMGDGEGNPSADGRFLALCDTSKMFVVDMDPQPPFAPYPNVRIGPVYDFSDCGFTPCRLGWVSVSPSGKYVVCKYGGDHPRVFDLNPNTLALTPRPMPESSPRCTGTAAQGFIYDLGHCDMAVNPFDNDEDVLIGQEHCGWDGTVVGGKLIGKLVMARLRDGVITALTDPGDEAYPHHISTRNERNPGWAYVGYYPDTLERFADEIIAVKLDGSKEVRRFVQMHTNTINDCYRCEAHAVPSWDGRRVMWASNWALHCNPCWPQTEIKAFVVDARATATSISGTAPFEVTLDASRTRDPDGSAMSFWFDFGDGTVIGPQSARLAQHVYGPGSWTATVTVMDEEGATDTATVQVHVDPGGPPNLVGNPSFETSTEGWNAYAGSTLSRVTGGLHGVYALSIQGPANTSSFGVNDSPGWVQGTVASRTYRISAWVRSSSSAGQSRIRVREYLSGVQQGSTTYSTYVPLSPSWQEVVVDYPALQTGSELDVQILDYPAAPSEVFEVDLVSIIDLSSLGTTRASDRGETGRGIDVTISPNPVRSEAVLDLTTTTPGRLEVSIYDVHGRRVRTLADLPFVAPGRRDFRIAAGAGALSEGVYFYRVRTSTGAASGRFVVLE